MAVFILSHLLIICVLFSNTITKKISLSPEFNTAGKGKLNECKRCKILSDSFNHWIEKTARGKYEGGDAAWEETKLKSYSRSEIRLVEVQEGLCSEVKGYQDDCYMLAEEAEQVLENWWFNEGPKSADLYTWLCIENLQHCCPTDHFGDACTPCFRDKNNNVCSGHGKCHGEGTRKGNGTCLCDKGYDGIVCDNCATNFYNTASGSCEQCHKACNGCSGEGSTSCNTCKSGWQLELGECKDINECLDESTCKQNQFCINREGTHKCKSCHESCRTCSGRGEGNCTSCEPNRVLFSGSCLDEENKNDIIKSTISRLALYLGLFIILIFIFRQKSKFLSSLVVLIIAVYIYYSEKSCTFSSSDVVLNFIFN